MLEISESRNGYCFSCISSNVGLLLLSCVRAYVYSFILGLTGTLKGAVVTIKDCLFSSLGGNLPPLRASCLSFLLQGS